LLAAPICMPTGKLLGSTRQGIEMAGGPSALANGVKTA